MTGEKRWLRQCEEAWDGVARSQDLLITGGVPEGWTPNNHRTEGCAEADWVRLALRFGKPPGTQSTFSRRARHLQRVSFNQFSTGDFGHRVFTATGFAGDGSARAWWCCSLHGLRAFPEIHHSVFSNAGNELRYELPLDARTQSAALSAVAESTLGANGNVTLRITRAGTSPAMLAIRQPQWAPSLAVRLNAAPANLAGSEGYLRIERIWKAGDVVELHYDMRLRSEPAGEDRLSYWHGPWLLGASPADNPYYFNEITPANQLAAASAQPLAAKAPLSRRFLVPVAATEFACAFAEYPDQPGSVILRPIAEQTGLPATEWELRFRSKA